MLLIRLFSYLPFPLLYSLSSSIAWLLDNVIKYRRHVVEENLRNAFPALSPEEIRIVRKQFYTSFSDIWLETIKAHHMSEEDFRQRVQLVNPELPLQYPRNGQAFMILTAHQANWEWLLLGNSIQLPVIVDAAYQRLQNKKFDRLMLQLRSRFGANMIEQKALIRESILRRKIPRLLAMVADQKPHKPIHHYWTSFMNRPAPFLDAAEKLAKKLDMPVVFANMERSSRGHYKVTFRLITDNPGRTAPYEITEKYVRFIEEGLRKNPSDYLWSHKRWKHKPPAELVIP